MELNNLNDIAYGTYNPISRQLVGTDSFGNEIKRRIDLKTAIELKSKKTNIKISTGGMVLKKVAIAGLISIPLLGTQFLGMVHDQINGYEQTSPLSRLTETIMLKLQGVDLGTAIRIGFLDEVFVDESVKSEISKTMISIKGNFPGVAINEEPFNYLIVKHKSNLFPKITPLTNAYYFYPLSSVIRDEYANDFNNGLDVHETIHRLSDHQEYLGFMNKYTLHGIAINEGMTTWLEKQFKDIYNPSFDTVSYNEYYYVKTLTEFIDPQILTRIFMEEPNSSLQKLFDQYKQGTPIIQIMDQGHQKNEDGRAVFSEIVDMYFGHLKNKGYEGTLSEEELQEIRNFRFELLKNTPRISSSERKTILDYFHSSANVFDNYNAKEEAFGDILNEYKNKDELMLNHYSTDYIKMLSTFIDVDDKDFMSKVYEKSNNDYDLIKLITDDHTFSNNKDYITDCIIDCFCNHLEERKSEVRSSDSIEESTANFKKTVLECTKADKKEELAKILDERTSNILSNNITNRRSK